jgi:transitional endoplasmic reticulum ATPase
LIRSYIPSPDKSTRQKILEIHVKNKPISRNTDLERVADLTEGFSGADVSSVVNTAISIVMHDYLAR